MMTTQELLEVKTHFAFGENWSRYSQKIDEARIEQAEQSLLRLVGREAIQGRTFLDIGCGSGLFSLAAVRLGCEQLLAVDLDPKSVETTRRTLSLHAKGGNWDVQNISVFHLDPQKLGTFDTVYSWGVLHHTGAMYDAIAKASKMVAPNGMLTLALYAKTPFCGMWRVEKRIYSNAPKWMQKVMETVYIEMVRLRLALKGESLKKRREEYWKQRGMDMYYDTRDWLGGYPYESISPKEAQDYMETLGFTQIRAFTTPCIGLLGTGCDEYSFTRNATPAK
jgi:SAM-dependent methyltransferase